METLHPDFMAYINGPFKTENPWGYNYYQTNDVWYWFNLIHANNLYQQLPKEIQQHVNIKTIFQCPDTYAKIIKQAEMVEDVSKL